jgi:hypothetical protein
MLHTRQDLAFRRRITLQLIGDDHAGNVLQPYAQFAEKSFGGLLVAAALDQDIEYIAILVDRSPEGMPLALDRKEDAHPSATCRHNEAAAAAIHWRRSAQTSGTTAEPFHR